MYTVRSSPYARPSETGSLFISGRTTRLPETNLVFLLLYAVATVSVL